MAVSIPKMYLEGARFLCVHIQHLNNDGDVDMDLEGGGEDANNNNTIL